MVHPAEGYFHCFGCGAGGDVITFIMKAENLSYIDALEFLAQKAGMELPVDGDKGQTSLITRSENLSMNREAARFFHACLMDPNNKKGLDYYMKERGLSLPLIKHFGLGYAPDSSHALLDHLKKKGYSGEQIYTAGLAQRSKNTSGAYYDMFRARVMVPMLDTSGNVVAFSGRRIDGVKMMKYVNTPDTPAFRKGKYIFALNFAKDFCKEQLILCEGQMDVISLHGVGFPQAIATMGTAITPEQARMMKRYTDRVVICYDADEAGQTAAEKAFRLLSEVGIETRILTVKDAKDPDEYVKKFGKSAFSKLLVGSKTRFDYKFEQILAQYDIAKTDERIKACEETVRLISGYASSVERELYTTKAAEKLGVSVENLKNDVQRVIRSRQREKKRAQSEEVLKKAQGYSDRVNPQTIRNVAAEHAEEAILGLMMIRAENAHKAITEGAVKEEDFVTEFNKKVFLLFKELVEGGRDVDPTVLQDRLSPDETGRLISMRDARAGLTENGCAVLLDCVKRLRSCARSSDKVDDIRSILDQKRKKTDKPSG